MRALFDGSMRSRRLTPATRAQVVAAALALVCYLGALRNGFAYDDVFIVLNNSAIHSWATVPVALHLPYWYTTGYLYRPLTTLSFALDWIVSGGAPLFFHAVNIAWHAVAAALVARLALRWWSPAAATAAGCIFAVHPVHVEVVANIVGRSELMSAVALLALALVASRPLPAGATVPPHANVLTVGVLAAVAMASKESGIAAPAIAWASAWLGVANGVAHPSRDTARRATIRMTLAASVGVAFELAARVHALGGLGGDRPHAIFRASTPWEATALALATLPRALGLILVPQPPRPDYSPTEAALLHPNGALVVLGALLVSAAVVAVLAHARRPTAWTLAAVFAVATFAPASNLVIRSGVVLADRTLYSPSVGVALVYGGALAAAWRARARLVLAAAGAVTLIAIILTVRAVPMWHDSLTVIAAMRDRAPTSYRSFSISASERDGAGDHAAAHAYYIRSIALFGLDPDLLQRAADNALVVHDTAYALAWLDQALRLDSARSVTRTALARLLIQRGDTARARVLLQDGLRRSPEAGTWNTWREMLARLDLTAQVRP